MKKFSQLWAQLQPTERRWMASIGIAIFLVLNWIFVWPHFHDWRKADARMQKAQDLMALYGGELKNTRSYENRIHELEADGGSQVNAEDQAIDLIRFYTSRANSNNVQVINNSRISTSTNDPFFVNNEMQLSVVGRESAIVNFLYSLGAGDSIVRVRSMSLRPDSTHQQINANISIVASYAKKPPVRNTGAAAPAAGKTAAPVTRPAPAPKPVGQTNKPLVTATHTSATNKPVPINAKRP
jgi:hypothetical protein